MKSPRSMFKSTVSAISSALCPVTILLHPSFIAPLSKACLLKTPQYVQLLDVPITFTISSIVQPYNYLYPIISSGSCSITWLLLTTSSESSLYPAIPSSIDSINKSTSYFLSLLSLFNTCPMTVESLPPLIPMAILSPGLKSLLLTIVWCISSSNISQKHSAQMGLLVLGLLINAFLVLQVSHSFMGAIKEYKAIYVFMTNLGIGQQGDDINSPQFEFGLQYSEMEIGAEEKHNKSLFDCFQVDIRDKVRMREKRERTSSFIAASRLQNLNSLCNVYQEMIDKQTQFNPETFTSLLHMSDNHTSSNFRLLGNYMLDYPEESTREAFQKIKNMKSESPYFAWLIQILVRYQAGYTSDLIFQIHNIVNSSNPQTLQNGLRIISQMLNHRQIDEVNQIVNINKILIANLEHERPSIALQALNALLFLLDLEQTRDRVIEQKALKPLLSKMINSPQNNVRILKSLNSLLEENEMESCNHMFMEVSLYRLSVSNNVQQISLLCEGVLLMACLYPLNLLKKGYSLGLFEITKNRLTETTNDDLILRLLKIKEIYLQRIEMEDPKSTETIAKILSRLEAYSFESVLLDLDDKKNESIKQVCQSLLGFYSEYYVAE